MVDARIGLDLRLTGLGHLFLHGGHRVGVDVVVFFGEVEQRRAGNPLGLVQAFLDAAGVVADCCIDARIGRAQKRQHAAHAIAHRRHAAIAVIAPAQQLDAAP